MPTRSQAETQQLEYKLNPNLKLSELSEKRLNKELLKSISQINDPAFCEAMIIQFEARRHQLNLNFESYTPKR